MKTSGHILSIASALFAVSLVSSHAQAQSAAPGYVVIEFKIKDAEGFKTYSQRAPATITQYGGSIAQEHRGSHGVGHFKLHHWYKTLRQPGTGYECCDQKDCRATTARARGPHIEVLVDGEWTRVPPNTILEAQSPDLNTHVCAPKGSWSPKPIFCVVLGFGV